ncbi:GNAT family N-acetyltransferase [Corynebacterium poyangense]|uniref:GNAT family N-acetyltransferase n=1 Tax=Corynebacterium poyangense TaxID=2684405 RepID=A0A7H0SRD6_9CORY|nr:GNAT family N-acetyltransferase [Corynebacterium poyangense]MBZ8176545.1 GNAT family N-acetyltransferase [Corynebacterium poyangense]QNQ91111.1 GNAT family N-acetyltransferase [Corynebacterium poyangense]
MRTFIEASPLRELSPVAVHQLYKLRVDVFVHEQRCPYREIDDHDALNSTTHLLVWDSEQKDRLLGCARFYPQNEVVMLGRIITSPDQRGQGQASEMIRHALDIIKRRYPDHPVRLHAQSHLTGFYGHVGFRVCGEPFMEEGISHTPMQYP